MKRRAPLLVPAVGLLGGIVADAHGVSVVMLCCCVAAASVRRDLAVGGILGLLLGGVHGHPVSVEHEGRTARYAGTVTGDVQRSDDGRVTFPFRIAGIGTLRATSRDTARAGERLVVRGRIEPLDEPRNPGEPSARLIALDDGIVGELIAAHIVERAPPDKRDATIWPALLRADVSRIVRGALPEPAATVLAGALFGERGTLPQTVRDDFQATGTVHVLVTAGLHLGVVAALVCGLFGLLRLPRIAASIAAIPLVYGYAWLSGWHLPAQRAAAMIAIALVARACGARSFSLNTLAAAAIVVAACWPVAVESVSFALSFSCVTAIVLFADPIRAWFEARRMPALVAETLALTISTQIGVWPLTAAVFFTLAPYAVLANAVVVPLIGATMVLGLAAIASHSIAPVSTVFVRWELWLLAIILAVTHQLAALPGARVTLTPPPGWAIVGYDCCAIACAGLVRPRPALAAILLFTACCAVVLVSSLQLPEPFTITVLDVGQGDGIVIRTPHRHTILIDTGGRLERGPASDGKSPAERSADRVVIPYLRRAGITRIDLMILTHPHGDHVGGCLGIVTQFAVAQIFDSGQSYAGRAYADCRRAAMERHVPIRVVRRGVQWSTDDGVSLDILAPTEMPLIDTGDDVNENSIVAHLTYARGGEPFTALFMGDAGMARESELVEKHIDLRATFLKVGHHGSGYASKHAFIAAVLPHYAVISVGRHNLFGHPAPATIDTLQQAGTVIFRTDHCGAVTITPRDGSEIAIKTMLPCV